MAEPRKEVRYIPPVGTRISTCKCGKKMVWFKTDAGKNMPLSYETADAEGAMLPHWTDCTLAKEFKKKGT